MTNIEQKTSNPVLQFVATGELEKIILLLAKSEKRSKSNMIRTLIEEAIEHRENKSRSPS